MKPANNGAHSILPAPEFVVLCSKSHEWRTQAELIAQRGRPMLLVGPSATDLEFLEGLAKQHGLSQHTDHERRRYFFWRPDTAVNTD